MARLKWTSRLRKLGAQHTFLWPKMVAMIRSADRIIDYAVYDKERGMWLVTDTDMRLLEHTKRGLKALVDELLP